jgi:cytoskeletal protein CcmA (bactofilin family)
VVEAVARLGEESLGKKRQFSKEEISALLGGGTDCEGKLTFEGTVRIDGRFNGQIRGEGIVIIGEKGVVQAEIHASVVTVRGEARGAIHAQDRIEAYAPAKIYGDLHSPVLVFGEGVIFQGTSHMTGGPEQAGQ